jgi:hypothetical protein
VAVKAPKSLATTVVRRRDTFYRVARNERRFLVFLGVCFFLAAVLAPLPAYARWFGFALAAYSTVANDSIQTIGAFLASNHKRPWWLLWLFIGVVFLVTVLYGWVAYDGDVTYGRLAAKGFDTTPETFNVLQLAAPIFLLIITRLRMPVSTTFLILSCFATEPEGVWAVLEKSLFGYVVAFVTAVVAWNLLAKATQRYAGTPAHPLWYPAQWLATGTLWATWIMQDAANLAVYLPRRLDVAELAAFCATVFFGLGVLFYLRGDRIQRVVDEKSDVIDIRSATLIDVVYAVILFGFVKVSPMPMSTTWVFVGLLAGRELTLILRGASGRPLREGLRLAGRDLLYASIGLVVSIILALGANPVLR